MTLFDISHFKALAPGLLLLACWLASEIVLATGLIIKCRCVGGDKQKHLRAIYVDDNNT